MKRTISFILTLILCFSLCACTEDTHSGMLGSDPSSPTELSAPTDPSESTPPPTTTEPPATSHTHTWNDATCTTPKTCTVCSATDGEAAGHAWLSATCTEPKTCSSCGAKDGSANGHNWRPATCSEPKICTVCRATSGLTAGHNFSNGKCTTCGKDDPDYSHETMVWIPTKGGKKYHTNAECSNMDDPELVTQSEAESRGFTPCKRCH